jgi:GMP synthase-like glutamine amidotransferase
MRIHCIQHVPYLDSGCIAEWAQEAGCELSTTRLWAADVLPSPTAFDLIVVLGGPMSVYDHETFPWLFREKRFLARAVAADRHVLGFGLGAQLLADVLGAPVRPNTEQEVGWYDVRLAPGAGKDGLLAGFPDRLPVFLWHGDTFELPSGASLLASSDACSNQGFVYRDRVIALQFHPEITPIAVDALLHHCSWRLGRGPFTQSAYAMLCDPERFVRAQGLLRGVLERVAARVVDEERLAGAA